MQADLLRSTVSFCEGRVGPGLDYGALHRECFNLFPDEMFADLFTDVGRRSMPPMIVAVVMVLQRIEGLSDREAVERFAFGALEVRRRRPGLRLSGVCAHRVGGHRPIGRIGSSIPRWRRPGRRGWWAGGGCVTRWPPWTRSR